MTTVYIVEGNCGSYEDYRTWVVAIFTDEKKAEEWAEGCRNWAANTLKWLEIKARKKHRPAGSVWDDVTGRALFKRFGSKNRWELDGAEQRQWDIQMSDIIRSFNPFDEEMMFDDLEVEYQVYQGGKLDPTCNYPVIPAEPKDRP